MVIASMLNKLFLSNGIKLSKVPKDLSKDKNVRPSTGHILELIGPSGVGKTYFKKYIHSELERAWFFRGEVRKLSNFIGGCFSLLQDEDAIFVEKILNKKYQNIAEDKGFLQRKVSLYDFFVKEMAADVYFRHTHLARGMFSDDGITHNFSKELLWYHDLIAKKGYENEHLALKRFFDNRSLILYDAPLSHIVKNLKTRSVHNAGAGNDWFGHIGEKRIAEFIEESKERRVKLLSVLQQYGVEVLTLDATESLDMNKQKVLDFSSSIVARNN